MCLMLRPVDAVDVDTLLNHLPQRAECGKQSVSNTREVGGEIGRTSCHGASARRK